MELEKFIEKTLVKVLKANSLNLKKEIVIIDDGSKDKTPEKGEEKPSQKAKLPPGEYADWYDAVFDMAKEFKVSVNDPLVKLAATFCAFMAKNGDVIFNLIPDKFMKILDEEPLVKEQFSEKEREALLKRQWNNKIPLDKASGFNVDDYKDLTESEASVRYVSSVLFGQDGPDQSKINNPKILAARLSHLMIDEKKLYKKDTLRALNTEGKVIPKGTVIFFTIGFTGQLLTAYATGNKKEFVYFTPGMNEPKRFELNAEDSPLKTELALKAAFSPVYNTDQAYFAANPQELAIDTTPFARITKLEPKVTETKKYVEGSLNFSDSQRAIEGLGSLSSAEIIVKDAVKAFEELKALNNPEIEKYKAALIQQVKIYDEVIRGFFVKYDSFIKEMIGKEKEKEQKDKELADLKRDKKDEPRQKILEQEIVNLGKQLEPYIETKGKTPSPDNILSALTTLKGNSAKILATYSPSTPAGADTKPAEGVTKPADTGTKPAEADTKLAAPDAKPAAPDAKPVAPDSKPAAPGAKPA